MRHFLLATVAAAFTALGASQAFAGPTYTLEVEDSSGANSTGNISPVGTSTPIVLGDITVENFAFGNSFSNPAAINFTSSDVFTGSTGSDTITFFLTVSGLTGPVPSTVNIGTSSSANFSGASILGWSTSTWFSATNAITDMGVGGANMLLSSLGGGATNDDFSAHGAGSALFSSTPYSYTVEYTLTLGAGIDSEADSAGASTNVLVPEPASLALLGVGMLGLVGVRRRARVAVA